MASSRILSSKAVNKLQVNRLDAQAIRSDNIRSLTPSFLFSLNFTGRFNRNSNGGELIINVNKVNSIIQFSDRPFRQTNFITFNQFIDLFSGTFLRNPPNGGLVYNEEQRSYIITLNNFTQNEATFNLSLLPGETHNISNLNGVMNLFVDNVTSSNYSGGMVDVSVYKNVISLVIDRAGQLLTEIKNLSEINSSNDKTLIEAVQTQFEGAKNKMNYAISDYKYPQVQANGSNLIF